MNSLSLYTIKTVIHETRDVFVWHIAPQQGRIFHFQPGQFSMIHRLKEDGSSLTKKPYSMSSSPNNKEYLEFGIKIHGDFTHSIAQMKEGDTIGVEGPFGVFTYKPKEYTNTVIFAGGIGITPFVSMSRFATESALENTITMFYNNQTENDIAFKSVLDDLQQKNPRFNVVYGVDNALTQSWDGYVGFINEEIIKKELSTFKNTMFLMCGPMPYMKSVEEILLKNSVPSKKIMREVF